ncbi:hypothetical protein E6C70_04025 [Glaciibacter flavus]|uniref:Fe-S oxidoreductase n=1 Tax=Orlajensenia flava TaxID=2565934 RepID=A0A4V3WUC3_9MICO|nr:hypothetical protein [Glaciibacter flavus]THG35237.1 hypothetical protein E6C70_04025 [Glaciibacter flavus]
MQLGTRWPYRSTERPTGLPDVVLMAVDAVETDEELVPDATGEWRWTLTWLEGRPVIELDDGTVIRYNAEDDAATITLPAAAIDDEDDW